jgi:hypothetical protein
MKEIQHYADDHDHGDNRPQANPLRGVGLAGILFRLHRAWNLTVFPFPSPHGRREGGVRYRYVAQRYSRDV